MEDFARKQRFIDCRDIIQDDFDMLVCDTKSALIIRRYPRMDTRRALNITTALAMCVVNGRESCTYYAQGHSQAVAFINTIEALSPVKATHRTELSITTANFACVAHPHIVMPRGFRMSNMCSPVAVLISHGKSVVVGQTDWFERTTTLPHSELVCNDTLWI
jgi:hypothetical protein